MIEIHKTAIVSDKAKIGDGTVISPFALIEDDVIIGENCYIGPQVCIYNGARIGNNVKIYQSASISHRPQDLKYNNEKSFVEIDDNTTVHEFATVHRGTGENGVTKIGKNCLLMAYTHVAHDCIVGHNTILANVVQLAGHVEVGNFVTVGGAAVVHQFTKIGSYAMVRGGSKVSKDVPPYCLAADDPLKYLGLNRVGLMRKGFTTDDLNLLKDAFNIVYYSGLNVSNALQELKNKFSNNNLVEIIINFIENSKRGIIPPTRV
ncbi:MAG TPA: acyl-ACP--UDP-N-acetylglucosamine O-acyltransferase [Ignavibacteriales bacterium]|nr:acyl-ACP--UDP-N-acetylglucosamine O-acyltransferase [Ignavibacteriales bacterium]HOL80218.1 acyl-ACP--UDP-N-acetylglucosamine O-acyltransferase [Ignavibacteriales bacterium]HOM64499.1 acyl-ACP--UDP-N-acetylglucosamine O-acyltransferase [Ignavibacteriales bacterium]HPD66596.1 acyl-ACP--UDP-N-acetylglucosamine O-acyltransferase [Ignavibacteriales bacterium]HPP32407.1 acyl-ACP--UDP-N-acetylglucosamine O-acyltransferase [Ignavibacteriales bacterium]